MSNIIRHAQGLAEDIQPFTLPEATTDPVSPGGERPGASKIIRSTEALAYPVRAFTWHEDILRPMPAAESVDDPEVARDTMHTSLAEHEQLLRQAQEAAEHCLSDARVQAAALTAEAYSAGFTQGEEAAREAAREQAALVLASFQSAVEEVLHLRAKILRLAEEDVITLALYVARKIIHQEVLGNHEVLTTTLRRALDYLIDSDNVVVRVNPADLQYALELREDLLSTTGRIRALTLQADAAIGRGGCVVESAFGEIDARLEAQIEEVERRFRAPYSLVAEAPPA